ncbi:ricin B lectin domain-containing protein [Mycena amicta]|nr:ricin B lectin domain-containing protein [Mycena amicta]
MLPPSLLLLLFPFLALSTAGVQIQSLNPAFADANLQGCIAAPSDTNGAPLVIHNCNTEALANQDWQVNFFMRQDVGPQQIKVFGNKCIDVTNGVNAAGTLLQIWDCSSTGNPNQQWISVTDNSFRWNGTEMCIDLTNGSILDNTQLQLSPSGEVLSGLSGNPGGPFCLAAASNTNGAAIALGHRKKGHELAWQYTALYAATHLAEMAVYGAETPHGAV